jgi:putative phage-type endonuclease
MIIVDSMEQGTPEWHSFRRTKIGASDCPVIMGKSPFRTAYQLWREKILGEEQKTSRAMKRGSELEMEARKIAEEFLKEEFKPAVAISERHDWMMASLDGLNPEKTVLLEIKCPGEKVFDECSNEELPEYWEWQVQHQLAVTECEKAWLCVYSGESMLYFALNRNQVMIDQLMEKEKTFWFDHVCEEKPPELSERDFVERSDDVWLGLVSEKLDGRLERRKIEKVSSRPPAGCRRAAGESALASTTRGERSTTNPSPSLMALT